MQQCSRPRRVFDGALKAQPAERQTLNLMKTRNKSKGEVFDGRQAQVGRKSKQL